MNFSFKQTFLSFLGFFLFSMLFVTHAFAANGVTTGINLLDLNTDGDIETIDLLIDNDALDTWSVDGTPLGNTLSIIFDVDGTGNGNPGTAVSAITSVAIQGSATADPVTVRITLDEFDIAFFPTTDGVTSLEPNIEVVYTPNTGDQTCTNCIKDGTDNELNAIVEGDSGVTDTEIDNAAPIITYGFYNDNLDGDGKIDQFIFTFSEQIDDATSTLSASNFTFANVGDFTGAAFGADATDLLNVAGMYQVEVTLGTEATAVDTAENSGSLAINLVGVFNLQDNAGNLNSTTASPMGITYSDQAYPIITNLAYTDTDNSGTVDTISIQLSEAVNFTYDATDWNFSTAGDVGFSGDFLPGDCSGSGTTTITCTDTDNSDFVATANRTGLQSGAGTEPQWNYVTAYAGRFAGVTDFLEVNNFTTTVADAAQPILVSNTPADGATSQLTTVEAVMTFSEQITTGTFAISTTNDPTGGYTETWSSNNTVLTLVHANPYTNSVTPTFNITTADAANGTNVSFAGAGASAADPFSFTTIAGGGGSSFNSNEGYNVKGTMVINGGAAETTSSTVTLNITASVKSAEMVIGNDTNFTGQSWQPVTDKVTWELLPGLGDKTVYIRFRDKGQMINVQSDTIKVVEKLSSPEAGEATKTPDTTTTEGSDTTTTETIDTTTPINNEPEQLKLNAGDLIKGSTSSHVYYYGNDGKRHGFPNEIVYYTYYNDFSNVKIIGDAQLSSFQLGHNIRLRPGTWLVKITSDPRVYAIEPGGVLRWITTENIAQKLYGPDWNKKIIDIDVGFFVDYSMGTPITTVVHPSGTLVRDSKTDTIYIIDHAKKRKILNNDVFRSSGFDSRFVHNLSEDIVYETGDSYGSSEANFTQVEFI